MRGSAFGSIPGYTAPGNETTGMIAADAFPPRFVVGGDADVGEDGVAIQRAHDVGIGFHPRTGSDTEETGFGIDGVKIAVRANVHPGDVIADGPDFVALAFK